MTQLISTAKSSTREADKLTRMPVYVILPNSANIHPAHTNFGQQKRTIFCTPTVPKTLLLRSFCFCSCCLSFRFLLIFTMHPSTGSYN